MTGIASTDRARESTGAAVEPNTAAAPAKIAEFLAAHGGPFYELQARLKLLHANALQSGRRAVLFVALAWGGPFLLGLPQSLSIDQGAYLADPGAWAKFFVAIAAFVLAEQQVERGLRIKLGQFTRAPLIAPTSMPAATHAVSVALQRRDSWLAELVCLALAAIAALLSFLNFHMSDVSFWAVEHSAEGNRITAAGWWSICVSLPLFVFLFLRGVWRHLVWAQLLRKIARLELRLVAAHPDGKGGLGFLSQYPNAYVFFVFGMSAAIAAAVMKHLLQQSVSMTTFSMIMSGWLAIVIAFFAYPLSAFSKPLARLKEAGLLMLGVQATRFHRAAERKVLGRNVLADTAPEPDEEMADPSKLFDTTNKLSSVLVSRASVVPVAAAALIPFAFAGATRLPYKEVFSVLKKLLLL
ncbi:hypothetical protein LAC81_27975 [Ensifer adhaerens]|uniref:hypothetical protein n=1 Tax=Ensifer adhaerens TaxID=106592 RepID=UPI001CBC80DB|nr:hypothetical protein [Ensifer adhaerens]MBZ7924575.1 hypothetical protein [Ensifer adhaerens]UAX96189.1 hypothetical protein LAC78_20505 [Ensifer adhaerens]UAY04468.1 hypothetical protein LAC80_24455 [Ensifer adhaerens]UAY09900.1 hypothetical protein LAC81_27975 [Ensifer adhaerens]